MLSTAPLLLVVAAGSVSAATLPWAKENYYARELGKRQTAQIQQMTSNWWNYVACYTDSDAADWKQGPMTNSTSLTPSSCTILCDQGGYTYSVLTGGNACYCLNGVSGNPSYQSNSNACLVNACTGASQYACGGNMAGAVYMKSSGYTSSSQAQSASVATSVSVSQSASLSASQSASRSASLSASQSASVVAAQGPSIAASQSASLSAAQSASLSAAQSASLSTSASLSASRSASLSASQSASAAAGRPVNAAAQAGTSTSTTATGPNSSQAASQSASQSASLSASLSASQAASAAAAAQSPQATGYTWVEADTGKLSGTAAVYSCAGCADGQKVGYLGNGNGNTVTFTNVLVGSTTSTVAFEYINADTVARTGTITVNGGTPVTVSFPISGNDWSNSISTLTVSLSGFVPGGQNTLVFDGTPSYYGPDLSRVGFNATAIQQYQSASQASSVAASQSASRLASQTASQQASLAASQTASQQAGVAASQQASLSASQSASQQASLAASQTASQQAAVAASQAASQQASLAASQTASQQASLAASQTASQQASLAASQTASQQAALASTLR